PVRDRRDAGRRAPVHQPEGHHGVGRDGPPRGRRQRRRAHPRHHRRVPRRRHHRHPRPRQPLLRPAAAGLPLRPPRPRPPTRRTPRLCAHWWHPREPLRPPTTSTRPAPRRPCSPPAACPTPSPFPAGTAGTPPPAPPSSPPTEIARDMTTSTVSYRLTQPFHI